MGNGYYALFPIELPNTPETRSTIQKLLETLAQRFNTARGDNRHHSRRRITYSLPDRDHQEKGRPDRGAASSSLASC